MEKIAISTEVPKIPYRFVMLDVWYDLPDAWGVSNPDGMTAEAFGRVLDGMMSINTSRLITIVAFLSHSQKVPFFEQLKERCNAGVELAYWVKAQSNPQPGDRLTSVVEEILIGYHNNEPDLPNTKRVSEFFNFKKIDPDNAAEVPRQLNVFEIERVSRFFCPSSGDKKALNVDQKPLALYQHIYTIMNAKGGQTVLDLGCGSAAASHAALMMGMNAMAIDHDPVQVRGSIERLTNVSTVATPYTECGFAEQFGGGTPGQGAAAGEGDGAEEGELSDGAGEDGDEAGRPKKRKRGAASMIDDEAEEDGHGDGSGDGDGEGDGDAGE